MSKELVLLIHHQFKYLVLHGNMFVGQDGMPLLLKLMEHYGHGDIIKQDNWDWVHKDLDQVLLQV